MKIKLLPLLLAQLLQRAMGYPHESGTTLRLLLPVAASICNDVDVDAKGRLPDRPLEPMLSEMKAHGVTFSQDKPPFTMMGRLQGSVRHGWRCK